MQQENKTVDIDTSGPGAEIELEDNSKENENELEVQNEKIIKTILSPMTHLRNLVSSLIFRLANKKNQKKMSLQTILKVFKKE